MLDLCKEFYAFNENCQILSLDYIRRYADRIKQIYNVRSYIKKVKIENVSYGYNAIYSFDDKKIRVCYGHIKEMLEEEFKCRFDMHNINHVARFNAELIFALSHECFHGIQLKCAEKYTSKTVAAKLFLDSIDICTYKIEIYDRYYKYIPIETNAEILGKLFGVKFINLLADKKVAENNNAYIAEGILNLFEDSEDNYISPTEIFYKLINEEKRYKEILEHTDLSNYKRMIFGLTVDNQYLDELNALSTKQAKTTDLRKYLKSR